MENQNFTVTVNDASETVHIPDTPAIPAPIKTTVKGDADAPLIP
jgi:hypothetical protein